MNVWTYEIYTSMQNSILNQYATSIYAFISSFLYLLDNL